MSQLLTYTAADTTQLFYFGTILTLDDFGLNFSPAVKELAHKSAVYATNSYTALLGDLTLQQKNKHSLTVASSDVFCIPFFDVSARTYYAILTQKYQSQHRVKTLESTTNNNLQTYRSG
jgi:hypothetical protein